MKVATAILALLSLANANILEYEVVEFTHIAPKNLDDLLQQFAKFIPFDKCLEIVDKYYANDPDVQAAYNFLQSDEFAQLANKVGEMPEYKNFLKYLYDSGLDIYTYRNIIRGFFGLPPIDPIPPVRHHLAESGIVHMVREILGVLPIQEIKEWFNNVCLPDPNFQDFLARIRSQEFRNLVDKVHNSPEYKDLTDVLRSQGIDVDEIEKVISDFINGSNRKIVRTLKSLLDEIMTLIPQSDILNILGRYYLTDPDIQGIVAYLKGEEFRNLAVKIEGIQEFKDFLAYIYEHGIDVYSALNRILSFLDLPPVNPEQLPIRSHMSKESGLTKMIDEIVKILPVDEISLWYAYTCEPDPEFQDVLAHLRSDKFMVVVKIVYGDPAYFTIHDGLISLGIDADAFERFLYNFLGW